MFLKYIHRETLEQGSYDFRGGFLNILQPQTEQENSAPLIVE